MSLPFLPRWQKKQTLLQSEQNIFELIGSVARTFSTLPQVHSADVDDVVFHVHAIQNIILARAAYYFADRMTEEELKGEPRHPIP